MPESDRWDVVQDATARVNHEAARTSRAWLTGLGLADGLTRVARQASDVLIPTPGLEELRDALDETAADVTRGADLVLSVANRESDLPLDSIELQMNRCAVRADEAEAYCRALAQLGLGVTSHAFATDEVMRLERAAVIVLAEAPVGTSDVEYELRSSDEMGLRVEVAGLLARIFAETETAAAWRSDEDGEAIEVIVNRDADLSVWFPEGPMRRWSAPVMVIEPAADIAAHLCRWSLPFSKIRIDVAATSA